MDQTCFQKQSLLPGDFLPDGLTLDPATGVISGTPTAVGTYSFSIKAENVAGNDVKAFSLEITPAPVAPHITTPALSDGIVNVPYSYTLSASGTGPITWSAATTLPAWLTLDPAVGVLSSTPTAAGTYSISVTATNATGSDTKALTLTVAAAPVPPVPPAPSTGGSGYPMAGGGYTGSSYQGSTTTSGEGALVCTVQADCERFASVLVDGVQLVRDRDYTLRCGSTIVTLTPSYVATFKDGAHTIRVQFTDGRYDGTFTTPLAATLATMAVPYVPATGGAPVWAVVLLLAGLGLALRLHFGKPENLKSL